MAKHTDGTLTTEGPLYVSRTTDVLEEIVIGPNFVRFSIMGDGACELPEPRGNMLLGEIVRASSLIHS